MRRRDLTAVGVAAVLAGAALLAAGCGGRGGGPVTLATYTFDDLKAVADTSGGLTIDHEIVESRPASLCVDAPRPRSVRLIEMTPPPGQDGRLLVWTVRARPLLREGKAWIETWARAPGTDERSARSGPSTRTRGWVDMTARIRVEKGRPVDRLRLNLVINGAGKFWIESVRLESQPLPRGDDAGGGGQGAPGSSGGTG